MRGNILTITEEIHIGNNVMIGANAMIMPGVHIGNNVIIVEGIVVAKNIEDGVGIGGVSVRIIGNYYKIC